MRREGRAQIELKRYELLMLAEAEREADRIRKGELSISGSSLILHKPLHQTERSNQHQQGSASELTLEVNSVLAADTIRKEVNVTRALLHAEEALSSDSTPETTPKCCIVSSVAKEIPSASNRGIASRKITSASTNLDNLAMISALVLLG